MFEFLTPPVVFFVTLAAVLVLVFLSRRLAFKKDRLTGDFRKAYACGEEFSGHMIQPDYGQFFPFAFSFTILHVIALMVANIPTAMSGTFYLALIYIGCAMVGLFILLRR